MLQTVVLGNTAQTWLIGLGASVAAFIVLQVLRKVLLSQTRRRAEKTETALFSYAAQMLERAHSPIAFVLAVYAGSQVLVLPRTVDAGIARIVVVALFIQVLVWGRQVIGFVVDNRVKVIAQEDKAMAGSIAALGYLAQMALLIIVLLLILANLGVEVTALVASIGIGGIALAMAAQNVLSDFIAFISIALDKPFVPGEFMNVGDFSGTVEQIGLRTTRLRSLSGEQLLLSNRDLLSSRIRNYGRMLQRRVVGLLGVTYQTSYENVQAIPQIIQEIVEGIEEATFDRAHFKRYADFALEFEFVYYVTPPAYALFMDVQQKVNLEIMKRFAEAGIEFAYPTQTIFLAKTKQ